MEQNQTGPPRSDQLLEQLKELEMLPLARAMVGLEVAEMRKINPIWCVRPEAQKMYAIAIKTKEEDLPIRFNLAANPDKYLEAATRFILDYTSVNVINKMHELWRQRAKEDLVTGYMSATTSKQRIGYLNALKNLDREEATDAYVVDMAHPSQPEVFALEWRDIGFLPRGELSDIKAKAKSGKTQLVKIFTAALISPSKECFGIKRIDDEPMNVLWVDTEQSQSSSDKAYFQTLRLAGLDTSQNSPHLKLINTRKMNAYKRWETIESELSTGRYDVIIIDGLRDLFRDINDPSETTEKFETLLQLTQDTRCSFLLVIHENPGESSKMRGWMGTEAENKCYEVFQVKLNKDTQIFTVETPDRRGPSLQPFGFKFEDNQLVGCDPDGAWSQGQGQNARPTREERDWNIFAKAWEQNPHLSMTKEEIITAHYRMGTLKESTVKNRIKQYLAQKKIVCLDDPDKRGARYGLSIDEINKIVNRGNEESTDDAPL